MKLMFRGIIAAFLALSTFATYAAAVPDVVIPLVSCSSACGMDLKNTTPYTILWKANERSATLQITIPDQKGKIPNLNQLTFVPIADQIELGEVPIPYEGLQTVDGSPDTFQSSIDLSKACGSLPCLGLLKAKVMAISSGAATGSSGDPNSKSFGATFDSGDDEKYYGRILSMDSTVIVGNPVEATAKGEGGCQRPFSSQPSSNAQRAWPLLWAIFLIFVFCYRDQRKKL